MDRSPVLAELPIAIPYTIGALVGGTLAVTGGVVAQYLTLTASHANVKRGS